MSKVIRDFDEAKAARLARGLDVSLLQCIEPVFVEFPPVGGQQRWSYVGCRIGLLAGNGWLVTYRAQPFDLRFGAQYDELGPTSREKLIAAAADYKRTDQLTKDVANLMIRWLAGRALTVASEIGDEIANRMLLFHRSLVDSEGSENPVERTRGELFDLRWVLDNHERQTRQLIPRYSPAARVWFQPGRDPAVINETEELLQEVMSETRAGRADLAEALSWLTGSQTAELINAQSRVAERSERLQRLVSIVTVFLLGPTLVATGFSALPTLYEHCWQARLAWMAGLMVASACLAWLLLRFFGLHVSTDAKGDGEL